MNPNRELLLDNKGAGTVLIQFSGNTSANQVSLNPAEKDFNLDVLNTGLGSVKPESLNPTQRKTGTPGRIFGSSDQTVLFTFQDELGTSTRRWKCDGSRFDARHGLSSSIDGIVSIRGASMSLFTASAATVYGNIFAWLPSWIDAL